MVPGKVVLVLTRIGAGAFDGTTRVLPFVADVRAVRVVVYPSTGAVFTTQDVHLVVFVVLVIIQVVLTLGVFGFLLVTVRVQIRVSIWAGVAKVQVDRASVAVCTEALAEIQQTVAVELRYVLLDRCWRYIRRIVHGRIAEAKVVTKIKSMRAEQAGRPERRQVK